MIDTHAHVFLCKTPLEEILENARQAGVTHMANVALDLASAKSVLALSKTYPQLIPTIGLYPSEAEKPYSLQDLRILLEAGGFKAIGEIGLDFLKNYATKEKQSALFEGQLQLALDFDLPVLIHNRQADIEMIETFRKFPTVKKVFHCFCSPLSFANTMLSINSETYFSFGGLITYDPDEAYLETIRTIPLERMMIETDCPYLTPTTLKGRENQPAYVVEIAKKIAEIKQVSLREVDDITSENARQFFGI